MTAQTDVPAGLQFVNAPAAPSTFNVLLWGQPKSGKSTAAATAPGPILWVNAEGPGALGFARKTAAERGTQIHEVVVDKKRRNAAAILDQVYLHVREGRDPQVRTVVVDTLAKVRDALIDQFVVPGSKNSLKQFGEVADKLGGFVNAMRDLPVNVVLLAHADIKDSDEDGRVVLPLIGGKLTETIPGEVDVVAYCSPLKTDDGIMYVGQLVEGRGRTGLGDRSGALGAERGFRPLDLSEWLGVYSTALAPAPADDSDIPFSEDFDPEHDGAPAEDPEAEARLEAERLAGESLGGQAEPGDAA